MPVDCATCKKQELRRRFVRGIGEEGKEVKLGELLHVPDFKAERLDSGLRWRILLHEIVKAVHVIVRQAFPHEAFLAGHAVNKKLGDLILAAACGDKSKHSLSPTSCCGAARRNSQK